MNTLSESEWKKRCAARYQERTGMSDEHAMQAAEATYEAAHSEWHSQDETWTENTPEEEADEDMECWDDDE